MNKGQRIMLYFLMPPMIIFSAITHICIKNINVMHTYSKENTHQRSIAMNIASDYRGYESFGTIKERMDLRLNNYNKGFIIKQFKDSRRIIRYNY